jgi:hypothetical protein
VRVQHTTTGRHERRRDVACTQTDDEIEDRIENDREAFLTYHESATDLEDGYRFRFEGSVEALAAVADFVGREARSCSFATFRIEYGPPNDEVTLAFTGPEGTRELLREGFFEEYDAIPAPS